MLADSNEHKYLREVQTFKTVMMVNAKQKCAKQSVH